MGRDDIDVGARIRGSQIHAMESNVWKSLAGYLLAAGIGAFAAYEQWADVLHLWGPIVVIVCLARIGLALHTALGPVRPLGVGTERMLMVVTSLVSATLAIGPAWIAINSEGFVSAIMIMLIVSSMWGGALVQASMFSSAASYTAANIPVWLFCLVMAGPNVDRLGLSLLFIVTVFIAIDNVHRYARNFEHGLRQQLELAEQSARLKQQADIIGLLLKEHEDQSSDWLWQVDAKGRIVDPSSRFAQVFSDTSLGLKQRKLLELLAASDVPDNEKALAALAEHIEMARPFRDLLVPGAVDGTSRWWSISGRPILSEAGSVVGYRGVMADITVTIQAQARVVHLAQHDALTGLPNRRSFSEHIAALSQDGPFVMLMLDLDRFKAVNDTLGHAVGDELLIAAARRLRDNCRPSDMLFRLGGDEMALLGKLTPDEVKSLTDRVIAAFARPFQIGKQEITVGLSIGVAMASQGDDPEFVQRMADLALYKAKDAGRSRAEIYRDGMIEEAAQRRKLESDLALAVQAGQFELYYQPLYALPGRRLAGFEALIRWHHPERGLVSPAEFIPVAEQCGAIVEIGAWVIDEACRQAALWPADLYVSINVSPVQLRSVDMLRQITEALSRHRLTPRRIEIEVTETAMVENSEQIMQALAGLRALGVRIAMDDFGTGYSSLVHLREFELDRIKIDRSFISASHTDPNAAAVVRAITTMAKEMAIATTGEGVENEDQLANLVEYGCGTAQGYLLGRPLDAEKASLLCGMEPNLDTDAPQTAAG
ncbi:MAG: EAL domain-containing protein [Devosia sp.]|nr:EAL domain-containing protein [Devosia sp.]